MLDLLKRDSLGLTLSAAGILLWFITTLAIALITQSLIVIAMPTIVVAGILIGIWQFRWWTTPQ